VTLSLSLGVDIFLKTIFVLIVFACLPILVGEASAQGLIIPDSTRTHWVVKQAEEIVQYITFDPVEVQSRLPSNLRFITIKELATGNVEWAMDYLAAHPSNGNWGVSFLEIVQMQTFMIDGLAPRWPENGAVALWCARVASLDSVVNFGQGRLLLVLDFWVPDSAYAVYMRNKGHYATYADVRLYRDSVQKWHGSIRTEHFDVVAICKPSGSVIGGPSSSGKQVLFPPASSLVSDVVYVAFRGHREQECDGNSTWRFQGTHPLVQGILVGSSIYEFGYDLIGGAHQP
jgi:hypothetical protein